jgi:hypothetical protein
MQQKHKRSEMNHHTYETQFQFCNIVIIRNPKGKTIPPSQYNITKI